MDAAQQNGNNSEHWLRRLSRHAVFPLLIYMLLAQMCRDKAYPLSHYPMYSQPTSRELKFQYVSGADGKPLPILAHTGITASQVGKQYSRKKSELIKAEEKRTGGRFDDDDPDPATQARLAEFKKQAGTETLEFLREKSLKRSPKRQLTQPINLVEVSLGFGDGHFTEKEKVVATIPAKP